MLICSICNKELDLRKDKPYKIKGLGRICEYCIEEFREEAIEENYDKMEEE